MNYLSLMANRVMNVVPKRPFAVTMSNFRDRHTRLPKGVVVEISMPAPVAIMEIEADELLLEGDPPANWRNDVNQSEEFEPYREQIIDLLKGLDDMWSGKLGEMEAKRHRIDLEGGAKPQYQHPYQTGLK